MCDKLNIKTTSTHKELTDSGKTRHSINVDNLKKKLYSYNTDPFSKGPAKSICTGVEADKEVIQSLLNAPETRNAKHKEFVQKCLITKDKSVFDPIKRVKLKTGVEKVKETPKAMSVLKEDRQAVGILVAEATSLEEAFCFPITTLPLGLATPDGDLRQSDKASFRNHLIIKSKAASSIIPLKARWIIDGMALFRTVKPKRNIPRMACQCAQFSNTT